MMTTELALAMKKVKKENEGAKIWFSDRDLEGVHLPRNDPLVVTLKLKNFEVHRILIDPGSSSKIFYYDCFKKLGIKEEDLEELNTPLVGFSSLPEYPKGKINLKVKVKDAYMQVEFIMVDAPPSL